MDLSISRAVSGNGGNKFQSFDDRNLNKTIFSNDKHTTKIIPREIPIISHQFALLRSHKRMHTSECLTRRRRTENRKVKLFLKKKMIFMIICILRS